MDSYSCCYQGLGFGVGFRLLEFEGFRHLSADMVLHKFQKSQRRLLLLDYDGTLTRSGNQGNHMAHAWATPTSAVMNNLAELSQDSRNIVFIMSGRRKEVLEQTFEHHPRVALSAEHGFHYRWNKASTTLYSANEGFQNIFRTNPGK